MNVGPTTDGRMIPIFEERLRQLGSWLGVNGEAIYSTIPWSHQHDNVCFSWYINMLKTIVYDTACIHCEKKVPCSSKHTTVVLSKLWKQ
jgi:alpha-L-fucosidase